MAFFLSQTDLNKICHNYLDPTLQTDLGLIFQNNLDPNFSQLLGSLKKKMIFLYIVTFLTKGFFMPSLNKLFP